jgi:arginyl-tRNA synthetase
MILAIQRQVYEAVADAARRQFGLIEVPVFAIEVPPNRALGDLAVTIAFQLARALRKPPRAIAQNLADSIGSIDGVARIVAAPNGYLNLYLDRPAFTLARLRADRMPEWTASEKTIVEHTAINPNKAAHVGHLRNAVLGDTLVRVLQFRNTPVEVQNYIDDTGVQVADVVVGFRELEGQTLDGIREIADRTRFDYFCWDLYARVTEWYEEDAKRLEIRAAALHDLEHSGNETADVGAFIVDRIVRAHLGTMSRLNISYDLLTYEGDILRGRFWARAFDILKAHGAVFRQTEGPLAGCWVMRIDDGAGSDGEQSDESDGEGEPREKVIVRSNGTVTYVGKDIANQFWKLGLLGQDFRYRRHSVQANGRILWSSTSEEGEPDAPPFGRASVTYNVIDSRQMYLQALLAQALRTLGYAKEAERSVHFSYEMVALSHATARELGYPEDAESRRKPFVEVSGRRGSGVKIDDLLDLLIEKASAEVGRRNPDLPPDERARTAAQIAVAAIRYFMLKFSRGKLIVFDIEEALSFEGETGPYLQYAAVRAGNILHKLKEREGLTVAAVIESLDSVPADELAFDPGAAGQPPAQDDLWAVVFEASRLDEAVEQAVRSLEFSVIAKYAFGLAQLFNAFYHRYPILNEEREERKRWRAAGVSYVRAQLTLALGLMGIEVPSRM